MATRTLLISSAIFAGVMTTSWLAGAAQIEPKSERPMTRLEEERDGLKQAFFEGVKKAQQLRRLPISSLLDCTEAFESFHRYQQLDPYIRFFESMDVSVRREWANRRQYAYFDFEYSRLLSLGYWGFFPGDKLVIVFTTASPESSEITSFKVSVVNSKVP